MSLERKLRNLFYLLMTLAVGSLIAAFVLAMVAWDYYEAPGPLSAPQTLVFKHKEGFQQIVDDMEAAGVIRHPWLFKAVAVILGDARRFNAGEYEFTAAISPRLIMDMIAEGRVVVHKLIVPEGFTVREIVALLNNEKVLDGDVDGDIEEGSLLPETYHFVYGEKRQDLINRMQDGMRALVSELWADRKKDLPFDTPEQAVTLASIVEKETSVANERGRVAAVFINRLRKGMKLQSDPTVIYGIEQQTGQKLGRPLTLTDLRKPTSYNTYIIAGLPPGPIANPGAAALQAVLNPPQTDDLYFVATGTGGHNFAATLKAHDANVKAYREVIKGKGH